MATATKPSNTATVTITESLSASARVDRDGGVIRNVKLIGFDSKNGRYYPPQTLKAAVHLYEGSKVNIDHPEHDPAQPRKYGERFGVIRNVRFVEGEGNYGDFHFNPKHPLAEQVAWDAENNPEALGFSHNAVLRLSPKKHGGKDVIESIISIRSMDLVADPATTRSLFESELPMDAETPTPVDPKESMKGAFRQMIMAAVDDSSLDMKATMKKIAEIMKAQEKLMGGGSPPANEEGDEAYGKDKEKMEESYKQTIASLTERLNSFEKKEKQRQLLESIDKELAANGLDKSNPRHVSELFSKQLLAVESESERSELIKDRAALLAGTVRKTESSAPIYKPETASWTEQIDPKTFAARLLS